MSDLNPEIKEDLRKQVEKIANGKGEVDISGHAEVTQKRIEPESVPVATHPVVGQPTVQPSVQPHFEAQPVQSKKYQPEEGAQMKKEETKIDPMIVVALLVLLGIGGLFLFSKFSGLIANKQQSPIQNYQYDYRNDYPRQDFERGPYDYRPQEFQQGFQQGFQRYPEDPYLHSDMSQLKMRVSNLEHKVAKIDHKTWLLAIANNENVAVSRRIASVLGGTATGYANKYVTFDGSWKLSKMPEMLSLSSSQRQKLLRSVNDYNYRRRYNTEYDYNTHKYRSVYHRNHSQSYYTPSTYSYPSNIVTSSSVTYPTYSYPTTTYNPTTVSYPTTTTYRNCTPTYNYPVKNHLCRPGRIFNWNFCR